MHYESHKTIVDELKSRVDTMKASLDYEKKAAERDELQEAMNDADFWNSPEKAQVTIGRFKLIKAQIDPLEKALEMYEDALVGLELAREAEDAELLEETDEQLHQVELAMNKVELQSLLSGKQFNQCSI